LESFRTPLLINPLRLYSLCWCIRLYICPKNIPSWIRSSNCCSSGFI